MPYIDPLKRETWDAWLDCVELPLQPGELTYVITKLLLRSLQYPSTYRDYCTLLGVLESTKLEFYRRVLGPYEDRKREENGEVYY